MLPVQAVAALVQVEAHERLVARGVAMPVETRASSRLSPGRFSRPASRPPWSKSGVKALFFAGELRGSDIAGRIKLPQLIIDDKVIEGLRKSKYIDLKGGAGMGVGKSGMIYTLTTYATDLIRQILDRNRYNGPAPVRLEDWFEAVNVQTVRGMRVNRAKMEQHFGELVVKDYVFDGLGPAINSGKAVFFYGPPGNGKTALCQALVECYDGDIWVPHALLVDDFIIRVYDSTLHKPSPEDPNAPAADSRWGALPPPPRRRRW